MIHIVVYWLDPFSITITLNKTAIINLITYYLNKNGTKNKLVTYY
jgi:hypothetical protein